jgi:hypothetical protein
VDPGLSPRHSGGAQNRGISLTSGLGHLAPRWLMTSGLALVVLAELSWLTLVLEPATYLLPLARFPAFAWLIAAG